MAGEVPRLAQNKLSHSWMLLSCWRRAGRRRWKEVAAGVAAEVAAQKGTESSPAAAPMREPEGTRCRGPCSFLPYCCFSSSSDRTAPEKLQCPWAPRSSSCDLCSSPPGETTVAAAVEEEAAAAVAAAGTSPIPDDVWRRISYPSLYPATFGGHFPEAESTAAGTARAAYPLWEASGSTSSAVAETWKHCRRFPLPWPSQIPRYRRRVGRSRWRKFGHQRRQISSPASSLCTSSCSSSAPIPWPRHGRSNRATLRGRETSKRRASRLPPRRTGSSGRETRRRRRRRRARH